MTFRFRPIRWLLSRIALRWADRADRAIAAECDRLCAVIQGCHRTILNRDETIRRLEQDLLLQARATEQQLMLNRDLQVYVEWWTALSVRREQRERMQPPTPQEMIDE